MSVTKLSKRRGTILDEIMAYHREQLPKRMHDVPLADLHAFASVAPAPLDFCEALRRPGVSLIAECKKASPSKGLMVPDYDPVDLARTYVRAGASAVSILTDGRHFQGSLEHLRDVKEAMLAGEFRGDDRGKTPSSRAVPILRKDFIFHPYQLYEARAAGADALLLIAAVLADSDIKELLELAHELGMNALVEVHTEAELERVLPIGPRLIGVNNRDLQTFEVDFANTGRLRALIPAGIVTVAESGIKTPGDVRRLRDLGVDAVLVGETLVRSKNVFSEAQVLVAAGS
jgi:indole-3-glycerol phosphate synthase